MQTAFDENSSGARRPEAYWAAVADLVSLIQRTRSLEVPPANAEGANDVAPAAVDNCNLRLREALHFLLEARGRVQPGRRAS